MVLFHVLGLDHPLVRQLSKVSQWEDQNRRARARVSCRELDEEQSRLAQRRESLEHGILAILGASR